MAAFDFDGTLTRRDTLLPFLRYLLGEARLMRLALKLSPTLLGYGFGWIDNGTAKERVFMQTLKGMAFKHLEAEGERFARLVVPGLTREAALRRLEWHKRQGHRCIAISASLELYVAPWAREAGFDDVIATRLEVLEDGRVTGKLAGKNCYGPEKVARLEALLGPLEKVALHAYGDSRGDRELLSAARHAYYRAFPMERQSG